MSELYVSHGAVVARFADALRVHGPSLRACACSASGVLRISVCCGDQQMAALEFEDDRGFRMCLADERSRQAGWTDMTAVIRLVMTQMPALNYWAA